MIRKIKKIINSISWIINSQMKILESLESWIYKDISKTVSCITGATLGIGIMAMVCASYRFEIEYKIEKSLPIPMQFDEKSRENQFRMNKCNNLEYALNSVLQFNRNKYQAH